MATNKKGQAGNGRSPLPQGVRFTVLRRDNFTCRYCGRSSPDVVLHVDHKHPVSRGGSNDESNLVTACEDCNFGKRAKTAIKPPTLRRRTFPSHVTGMVGMFGLSFEDGKLQYQFSIDKAIDRDLYAVQTYSWLDGSPRQALLMGGAFLRSEQCQLYLTLDAWHIATNDLMEQQLAEERLTRFHAQEVS